jgi:cell division protein FtsW
VGGVTFVVLIRQLPYAKERLDTWKAFWSDPRNFEYHVQQVLIALGSGGPFGAGLGQGRQKLNNLPAPHTDSIFAVLGEELGLVGCLLVIGLYVVLTYRGFRITLGAPDGFAALLACGITCWLAFQALVNIAVITGIIPFTGVTLPFISWGGSAMWVSLAGVGMLLSVSRGNRTGKRPERGSRKGANLDRGRGNRGTHLSRSGRHTSPGRR